MWNGNFSMLPYVAQEVPCYPIHVFSFLSEVSLFPSNFIVERNIVIFLSMHSCLETNYFRPTSHNSFPNLVGMDSVPFLQAFFVFDIYIGYTIHLPSLNSCQSMIFLNYFSLFNYRCFFLPIHITVPKQVIRFLLYV